MDGTESVVRPNAFPVGDGLAPSRLELSTGLLGAPCAPASHTPQSRNGAPSRHSPLAGESRKASSLFSEGGLAETTRHPPKPPSESENAFDSPARGE